uniref:Uncharacterized protein n=1 Tax=Arundo donax TaxID=35708 RepID=A0A0A8Y243_ARUDO
MDKQNTIEEVYEKQQNWTNCFFFISTEKNTEIMQSNWQLRQNASQSNGGCYCTTMAERVQLYTGIT